MILIAISLRSLVLVLVLSLVLIGGPDVARGAPPTAALTNVDDLLFSNPGQNGARDVHTAAFFGSNVGGVRIYTGNGLSNPPASAALQFFGNGHTVFPGQAFIDSGAHNSAAIIMRTSQEGDGLVERFRITSGGNIGIGTPAPGSRLTVRGAGASTDTAALTVENSAGQQSLTVLDNGWVRIGSVSGSAPTTNHVCLNNLYFVPCSSAAEYVPTLDTGHGTPVATDLVSLAPAVLNPAGDDHSPFVVTRSATACDSNLLGYILNPDLGADGQKLNDSYLPLAIYGYFPARVTMESGAIKRGDPITSSSTPGAGMKATGACKTIGYALEDAGEDATIQVFASQGETTAATVQTLQVQLQEKNAQIVSLEARLAAIEQRLNAQ